jgi:Skp family chaperone for outer membrane proteins
MATATDVVNSTASYITAAQNTANSAITTLNSVAAGWTAVNWSDLSAPAQGTYSPFSDADSTIKAALEAFDVTLATIGRPTLPTAPGLSGYNTPIWNDTFWSNLKNLLTNFTGNITGSDDVDTVVTKLTNETTKLQVALYAADLERKQQALRDAHSAANAATGARGFTYPNSMTTALKLDAQQKYMFDLSQTSRDLVKQIFEWAKNNYQFSVQQQISAHNADIDFNMRYAGVLVQVFDTSVRAVLDEYRTAVASEAGKMDQKIKEFTLRLDVTKTNASIVEAKDRIAASNFNALVQQHVATVAKSIETAASNARNKIDAAVATVNAAANMVASASQISIGVLNG